MADLDIQLRPFLELNADFQLVCSAPCMRFCSFSALRMRCSLALLRDLFKKAFGLRFISAVGASSLPLSFLFCSMPQPSVN